jgi:cyclopropane fatty-acyl-phospholipid synthase-like methyltransferase
MSTKNLSIISMLKKETLEWYVWKEKFTVCTFASINPNNSKKVKKWKKSFEKRKSIIKKEMVLSSTMVPWRHSWNSTSILIELN